MTISREQLSRWIAWLGGIGIASVGASLFLQDGSYFLDEASVVLSFEDRGVIESFLGPLSGGGQNFPRFYLLFIRGVRAVLGPDTWSTRLLPFLCFLGATVLWMRLFLLRFRRRPELVLLGLVLLAMAPSWWLYAAVVKQYSLDVFVTLAVLSAPDRLLDDILGRRKRLGWGLALIAPVLLSYVYPVALMARVSGWVAWRLRRGIRLDVLAGVLFAGVFALALGVLFWTDLQHTIGRPVLVKLWGECILSEKPDAAVEILRRFFASWYVGPAEFLVHPKLPATGVWLLLGSLAAGGVRVALSLVRVREPEGEDLWGSRSAVCLAGVVGVIATSWLLAYPICAGRTTLFAFFFQQLLLLEGIEWLEEAAGPRRVFQGVVGLVLGFLTFAGGHTAWEVLDRVRAVAPVEDVRPLLERIPEDTKDPVIVTACMARQIRTLPEGLGDRRVIYLPPSDWRPLLPRGREIWVIHSRLITLVCKRIRLGLEAMTKGFDHPDQPKGRAVVYHTRVLTHEEMRRRLEVHRALKRRAEREAREP